MVLLGRRPRCLGIGIFGNTLRGICQVARYVLDMNLLYAYLTPTVMLKILSENWTDITVHAEYKTFYLPTNTMTIDHFMFA